jgi:hypothetical protein
MMNLKNRFNINDFSQVYWLGPISGGVFAALLYTLVFTAPKPDETEKYRQVQQLEEKEVFET